MEGGPTDSHLKDFQLISKFGLEKSLNKKSQTAEQNSGNAEEYFVTKKNYACFFFSGIIFVWEQKKRQIIILSNLF